VIARRADLVLLLANVVYGTAYVAQRVALFDVPPAWLAFARLAVASVVLLPFLRRPPGTAAVRGDGGKIFWMGVLGFGVAYALSHLGLQRSTATNAALLITVEPVSLILLSPLVLGEHLRRREAAGAALVLCGTVLVVVDGIPGLTVTVLPHWRGDLLLVLSALAFAFYSLFGRDVLARWDARTVTARSIVWGAVSMAPWRRWSGRAGRAPRGRRPARRRRSISPSSSPRSPISPGTTRSPSCRRRAPRSSSTSSRSSASPSACCCSARRRRCIPSPAPAS
jgi:drug/metabolite transporter (DMT)-like permease